MSDGQPETTLADINHRFSSGENWQTWMDNITSYVNKLNSVRVQPTSPTSNAANLEGFASNSSNPLISSPEAQNDLLQVFRFDNGTPTLRDGNQLQQKTFEENLDKILDSANPEEPVTVESLTRDMLSALPKDEANPKRDTINRIIARLRGDTQGITHKTADTHGETLQRIIEKLKRETAPGNGADVSGTE